MKLLPANHELNENVVLNFFKSGKIINCQIDSIKFTTDKVFYDVKINIDVELFTIIKDVDSTFIEKVI